MCLCVCVSDGDLLLPLLCLCYLTLFSLLIKHTHRCRMSRPNTISSASAFPATTKKTWRKSSSHMALCKIGENALSSFLSTASACRPYQQYPHCLHSSAELFVLALQHPANGPRHCQRLWTTATCLPLCPQGGCANAPLRTSHQTDSTQRWGGDGCDRTHVETTHAQNNMSLKPPITCFDLETGRTPVFC